MLNFISASLVIRYFLCAFLACLGTLQVTACHQGLRGLSLLGEARRSAHGYLLGFSLIIGSFAWFFAVTPEVFTPGLAGSELTIVFGSGLVVALVTALGLSSLLQEIRCRRAEHLLAYPSREEIPLPGVKGTLYSPVDERGKPWPLICLVPVPGLDAASSTPLAVHLAKEGFAVLVVSWKEALPRYPDMLALVPSVLGHLPRREDIDQHRLGILGIGLGADLALRSASSDPQIRAVLAIAPLLEGPRAQPGLNALKEMTYLETIRWSQRGRLASLVAQLNARQALEKLPPHSVLLVYGSEDALTPPPADEESLEIKTLPGLSHRTLPTSPKTLALAARWFKERLGTKG